MTVTQVLGVFALAAGGSLLLSEPLLGPALLSEVTGTHLTTLYPLCAANIMVGAVAMQVGRQEARECAQSLGGNPYRRQRE